MPEPLVVQAMREFKRGLLVWESAQQAQMTRRWLQVERSLQDKLDLLAEDIARRKAAGETFNETALLRLERYQQLLAQVREEVRRYEQWAERGITAGQAELAGRGLEQAATAIELGYREAGFRVAFNRLPVEAVQNMVGLAGDGAPLFDVLARRALWPEAVDGLTQALVQGVAQGWNPRKTASRMADGLAQGLDKALQIARTEQLRVYRAATVSEYRASGVVTGYRRLCAKDSRACPACLAADGRFYALEADFSDHPAGRCTCVPELAGTPPLQWQTGAQWFATLPPARQRAILGDDYYDAWQRGAFEFGALATFDQDATWGEMLRVTPLSALTARERRVV